MRELFATARAAAPCIIFLQRDGARIVLATRLTQFRFDFEKSPRRGAAAPCIIFFDRMVRTGNAFTGRCGSLIIFSDLCWQPCQSWELTVGPPVWPPTLSVCNRAGMKPISPPDMPYQDSLAAKRGDGGGSEGAAARTLMQLLVEMDGISSRNQRCLSIFYPSLSSPSNRFRTFCPQNPHFC